MRYSGMAFVSSDPSDNQSVQPKLRAQAEVDPIATERAACMDRDVPELRADLPSAMTTINVLLSSPLSASVSFGISNFNDAALRSGLARSDLITKRVITAPQLSAINSTLLRGLLSRTEFTENLNILESIKQRFGNEREERPRGAKV